MKIDWLNSFCFDYEMPWKPSIDYDVLKLNNNFVDDCWSQWPLELKFQTLIVLINFNGLLIHFFWINHLVSFQRKFSIKFNQMMIMILYYPCSHKYSREYNIFKKNVWISQRIADTFHTFATIIWISRAYQIKLAAVSFVV